MPSNSHAPVHKARPYTQLARIYDYVMAHVDYRLWAKYLDKIFVWAGVQPDLVLDIACGTGTLAKNLMDLGYRVAMCDASVDMVWEAKKKFHKAKLAAPMWICDMKNLGVRKSFHGIICSYDSMNYLLYESEWETTLANVAASLAPRGIFIFDVCTEYNSLHNFDNYEDQDGGPGFYFIRRSNYNRERRIQQNEFRINRYTNVKKSYHEVHTQRIYTLEEIESIIYASDLSSIAMFEDFTFTEANERSERVHFVLQK